MKEQVAKFLRDQLNKKGLTMYEVAKESGIDYGSVNRIFSGQREPGAINLIKILKTLKVSKTDLWAFIENF